MSLARAEDGSTVELLPDADNWSALQSFVDAHTAITLPVGHWKLSRTLQIGNQGRMIRGYGVETTGLHLYTQWGGPVIGIGGNGRWAGSAGYGRADGCTVAGMTLWQDDILTVNAKCLFDELGDDLLLENLRVRGSAYEGIVAGSDQKRITLRDIEALDCGNGYPGPPDVPGAYYQSTAGINCTNIDLLIDGFVCHGCGQGVETGNTRVMVRNGCVAYPGSGSPKIGINVGSAGYGVYQTTVENCIVRGYEDALHVGNGIGKLCAVTLQRNDVDGGITFAGGRTFNEISHPDEGPDTEVSFILDNVVHVNAPLGIVIGYNGGLVDNDGLYGREPLTIARNRVEFGFSDQSLQNAPVIGFFGEITASCRVYENTVNGLSAAPNLGDVANASAHANPTVPMMPNLAVGGNWAFDHNSARRPFITRRVLA